MYFPVNIATVIRTASLIEQLQWLLFHLKEYDYETRGN